MANQNCSACEDIRQTDPNLIVNGFSDTECASLGNDTGLSPSSGNNDCTDLKNLNDCLIGNMETEVEAYDVCDWKTFMKRYIPNVWTVVEAIICAICGIWTNIHNLWEKVNCIYGALTRLVNALSTTTQGNAFVRFYRDNGTSTQEYWWPLTVGEEHTQDVYMDASGDSAGSTPADRDYVVIAHNCTNFYHFYEAGIEVTLYSSGDTRPVATIRDLQGQHADVRPDGTGTPFQSYSWTTSSATLVKKGEHLKINSHVSHAADYDNDGRYRLHQFVITWIPVNIDSEFDPSDILTC